MKTNPTALTCSASQAFLFSRLKLEWLLVVACLASAAQGANTFTNTGPLATARERYTATLLPNGKVLVAGGGNAFGILASAEIYDPATGIWSATGTLATARQSHTATLLPNGKVLVTGGAIAGGALASAELYDPATGTWSATGDLATVRAQHTATLLPNGKVLVAGGTFGNPSPTDASAEIYDPASGTWSAAGSLATARAQHTATLLPDGKLLVAGGAINGVALASAEIYDPAAGTWRATGDLATVHQLHTATLLPNGKVLVAGGTFGNPSPFDASAEIYDPATGTWSATGALATARQSHTATLLPNGKVLLAGGRAGGFLASTELYDPAAGAWSATGDLATARQFHTATLLPNGKVLVSGGLNGSGHLASVELYDPGIGAWNATGALATARYYHSATLLPSGKVLVAGGLTILATGFAYLATAEIYDPGTGTWSATADLAKARKSHTATLLPNGKVLIAGGANGLGGDPGAELYDPATGAWSATGALATGRQFHTATLLPNGQVLVAGGDRGNAELYDPATGTWSATGDLATPRQFHTATLLPNGKVLVAGGTGRDNGDFLASAELYDPASGTWSATGFFAAPRKLHTATLLPSGKVLIAGGIGFNIFLASAELYDPATGTWSATGPLATTRYQHTATLLPNGQVLVAGGGNNSANLTSAELYDPAAGTWTATPPLATVHVFHTATLLPNGQVLVAGSSIGGGALASAELYDVGLGFSGAWQPQISSASFTAAGKLVLTGSRFRGISSASGGNGSQDSPTSYPVVQLRRFDNEQTAFLLSDPAVSVSDTSFISASLRSFSMGFALVTVFANGIPSASVAVLLPSANHPPILVAISSKSTAMGQPTLPIQLRLDDPDDGDLDLLTLTGRSSNQALVRDGSGFAFEGSGHNWLLSVTPQPGQTGTAVLTVTVQDPAGATNSASFQLQVYSGPQILTQPIGWTVEVGASVSLDVLAKSTPESELTYQWYKDTNLVAGAASSSLLFTNAQLADSGLYRVVITNNLGQVTSNPAQFTVRLPSRPVVGTPVTNWFEDNRTLTLKLRVDPSGEEPLSYQWFRNGVALADGPATATPPLLARGAVAGATTQELTITNFQTADAGLFTVRVGNAAAVVESSTLVIGISEVTPQAGDLPVSDNLPDAAYLQDARNWLTTDQSLGKANTRGFKNEPDEPQHAGRPGGSSGWFLWKAEARGVAAFTSAGSAFDTLLAVYRQADPAKPLTFANLGTVASDDDGGGFLTSYVRFNAEREVIYLIALDDRTGQGGDAVLSWQFTRDVTAPVIKTQPVSLAVHTNDPPGQLSVTLEDNQDDRFTFVWFRNGVPLQEGVEGFGGVHTRTLTLVGWNEEKVALYTVAITNKQSGLSVESNPAIVELISGDASANYTARSKLADAFVPTRPPAGPGLAASLQRSDRRGIGLLTTGASAGTIITTGKGEGSIPPEGCGLEADTVWRVATDLGFPPKAFVVMEAEANKLPFNLSLWTSDCTLADLNDLSCLHAQNWNCVTVRNGNVARLEFAASPDLQYIIAINGVGGADGRVKLSWQTEILRSSITFKDGGWVVIDTGENPGLKAVEHVSISNQPDSSNPNLKVESNAAATRFWFPVLTGTNYAIKLNPESYPYEKLVYTTKAGSPNIEVAAAGSSDRKIRLSWSGEGVSLRSTTDLTATWQSNPDLKPIISGESHELNLTPGQTPAIFFRLVPDP